MKNLAQINTLVISVLLLFSCNTGEQQNEYTPDEITDTMIEQVVEKELMHYPEVPTNGIEVSCLSGIVKLKGSVDNILSSEKAVEIAAAVKGVKGIVNQIAIDASFTPDDVLKRTIASMLFRDPIVERYEVEIEASNGHVTLKGLVDSWGEKQLAEDIVKFVEGVKSVDNRIKINLKEVRPDEEIHADINGLMNYDVRIDNSHIVVDVNNGIVDLKGSVNSLSEKYKAISLAWVAGVDSVNAEGMEIISWGDGNSPKLSFNKAKPTDKDIKIAVNRALSYDARISAPNIEVEVDEGFVTLSGIVSTLQAKKAAGADAGNIIGVWSVENNITTIPRVPEPKKAVKDITSMALESHPYLKPFRIEVEENTKGKVSLSGEVKSEYERQTAEELVIGLPGVTGVQNNLTLIPQHLPDINEPVSEQIVVPPAPSDSAIHKSVEEELWWSPFVDEYEVDVTVDNGEVTLTGTVTSLFEKEMTEKNAFEGGAFIVDNNLLVEYWQ